MKVIEFFMFFLSPHHNASNRNEYKKIGSETRSPESVYNNATFLF